MMWPRPRTLLPYLGPIGLLMVQPSQPVWPMIFIIGMLVSRILYGSSSTVVVGRRHSLNLILLLVIVGLAMISPAPLLNWFLRFSVLLGLSLAFTPDEPNREWKLFIITFLLLLIAGAQTEDVVFAVPFAAFLALLPPALADLEATTWNPSAPPAGRWSVGPALALLSIAMFFLIPRSNRSILGRGMLLPSDLATMGDQITLDSITDIKQSPRIAMRVRVDRPVAEDVKWRSTAFDRYDGNGWHISTPASARISADASGWIEIEPPPPGVSLLAQEFQVEPGLSSALFAARTLVRVNAHSSVFRVYRRGDDFLGAPPGTTFRYTAYSAPPTFLPAPSVGQPPDPNELHRYLELPELSPRFERLARRITDGVTDDTARLSAIQDYFQREFTYSLHVERSTDLSPLEDFTFRNRTGHCEFFATAMVVLCRTLDIPARLVDGFTRGEYSDIADAYIVRRRDAHAWVEAFVPSRGWLEFDPTPPALPEVGFGSLLGRLRSAIVDFWTHYVADYSAVEQRALARAAIAFGRRHAPELLAAAALGAVALAALRRVTRRSAAHGRRRGHGSTTRISLLMEDALGQLTAMGVKRSPSDTVRDMLDRAQQLGSIPSLAALAHIHEQQVYAGRPDDSELAEARRLSHTLRAELRAIARARRP